MLRRFFALSLTALLLLFATVLPLYAQDTEIPKDASLLGSTPITEHLESEEDVNRHAFEMKEKGDAVICVTVEGNWSTLHYWTLSVLASDGQTLLQTVNVKDGAGATVLPLNALERGTYYVEITATKHFSTKDYTLALYTAPSSDLPAGDENTVRWMEQPGAICQIDGHSFVKLNSGGAFAALYRNPEGAIVPILISKDKSAVEYVFLTTGDIVKAATWDVTIDGETYYFTNADWLDKYTDRLKYQIYREEQLYLSEEQTKACEDTVKDILDRVEMNEKGAVWYFISNYWWLVLILVAIGLLAFSIIKTNGNDDDIGTGGYGGGGFVPPPDDDSDAWGRPAGTRGPPVSGDGI